MVSRYDLVVVMDVAQGRRLRALGLDTHPLVLGDLDPAPVNGRGIPDPWGADREVFVRVFDRIDRCVEELMGVLYGDQRPPIAAPARTPGSEVQ